VSAVRPDPGQLDFTLPPVTAGFDTGGRWHVPGGVGEGGQFAKPGWSGAKALAVHAVRGLLAREAARDRPDGAWLTLGDHAAPSLRRRFAGSHGAVRAVWWDDEHALIDVDGHRTLVPWTSFADPTPTLPEANDLPARPFTPDGALDDLYDPAQVAKHLFAGHTDSIDYRLGEVKGKPDGSVMGGWTYAHDRGTGQQVGEFQWRLDRLASEIEWEHAWVDPTARRQAVSTSLIQHANRTAADRLSIRRAVIGASDAGTVAWAAPEFGLRFDPDGHGDYVRGVLEQSADPDLHALAARFDGPPDQWPTPAEIRALPGGRKVLRDAGNWVGVADLHPTVDVNDLPPPYARLSADDAERMAFGVPGPGWTPDAYDPVYNERASHADRATMRRVAAEVLSRPAVVVPADVVGKIIESGRILTQHETGIGGGAYDPEYRAGNAHNVMGVPADHPDRVVHGLVPDAEGLYNAEMYGDTVIFLRPDRVHDRVSFTIGDSLDTQAVPIWPDQVATATERRLAAAVSNESQDVPRRYTEVQVHGGVTLDDIAAIAIPEDAPLGDSVEDIAALLRERGHTNIHVFPIRDLSDVADYRPEPAADVNDLAARPSIADRIRAGDTDLHTALVALYSMDVGDSVYTQAEATQMDNGTWMVRGQFVDDATGDEVGEFERRFTVDPDTGEVIVSHETLSLDPGEARPGSRGVHSYQHRGYGSKFTRTTEDAYRREGIDRIVMHAASVAGGAYDAGVATWAKAGYDWDLSGPLERRMFVRSARPIAQDLANVPYTADHIDPDVAALVRLRAHAAALRLDDLADRVERGGQATADDVTPYDIVTLGQAEGWPVGRMAMSPYANRSLVKPHLDFMYTKPVPSPPDSGDVNDLIDRRLDRLFDDPGVQAIMDRFDRDGHPVYIVGGALRSVLNGEDPNDIDLTTPALPEQSTVMLADVGTVYPLGEKFGTVVVNRDDLDYEVTTHRTERYNPDTRKPEVGYTTDLVDDLARRDFTVNAMAVGPDRHLIDPFGGRADLAAGTIRAVGDPNDRFSEDPLRIVRAVRFAATLGFTIDPATKAAAAAQVDRLSIVSRERFNSELGKVLKSDRPGVLADAVRLATDIGADGPMFGPLAPAAARVDLDPIPPPYRFAALVDDAHVHEGVDPRSLVASMKRGRQEMGDIATVVEAADRMRASGDAVTARRVVRALDDDRLDMLRAIQPGPWLPGTPGGDAFDERAAWRAPLPVDGRDMQALGFRKAGIGEALARVTDRFLADGHLTRDEAIAAAGSPHPDTRSGMVGDVNDLTAADVNDMATRPGFVLQHPQHRQVMEALAKLDDETLLHVRDTTDVPELAGRAAAVYAERHPASQAAADVNDLPVRPDGLTPGDFDIVDQGLSPLHYHRASTVHRVGAVNDRVEHPERTFKYRSVDSVADQDYWSSHVTVGVGRNGRRLKSPQRLPNPSAPQPGTAAFVDYHMIGDDRVYIDYANTATDYRGLGLASKLIDDIAAKHPDATIDFGKVMSPNMWRVLERLRHEGRTVDGRPDFGPLPEPRYPDRDQVMGNLEAMLVAPAADAPKDTLTVEQLLGPSYTLDDVRRLLRRGGLSREQRQELTVLRDQMTGVPADATAGR
jgi:GNAT superfamily N-acetyltransferase